jgi:hypothetical protein
VIEGEAGLRAEPAATAAKICFHESWRLSGLERSDRKKSLYIFFHVIHYSVQVVFFQKNVLQTDAVLLLQALRDRFGGGQLNPHFFVEKRNQLIGFNAGNKRAPGILLKHDLAGLGLVIEFHQIQGAGRHARSSALGPSTP